jgi:two-component system sensor histidine kinase KdpD
MLVGALKSFLKHTAFGSAGVVLLTAVGFRTGMNLASAISLYLFLIVLQSLTGDFLSSLFIAALSAACLDFFFTEPLFSLYINNPRGILALGGFAFTSLVITKLVSQVRKEAIASRMQKERLDRLYHLSQELLHLDPEAAAGRTFLDPFQRFFSVRAICIFDAETSDLQIIGDPEPGLADKTRDAYIRGTDVDEAEFAISVRCIRLGARLRGAIGFQGLQDPVATAAPLTALTVTFLERINAFRKASESSAAAQAELYRSAVLDALAHEFKTPLATILAAAGGLREAGPLEAAQQEMAETVESEAARLGSLTTRLLRTARLEKEDIKPRMELTDVSALVTRVARQYAERSPDRKIVTPANCPFEALADEELLRLAVNQLVENACKYSQPGSTVGIAMERQADFIAIRISNEGSSIPPNEQHRVFERFYRGADARRSTSGTGLGLYVARKIAIAHGGALDLDSSEGADGGVTFSLKLPSVKMEVPDGFTSHELTPGEFPPDELTPDEFKHDGFRHDQFNHVVAAPNAPTK